MSTIFSAFFTSYAVPLPMEVASTIPASITKIPLVTFEELLTTSDVISIHIPYTSYTENLFYAKTFQKMKQGSLIINTSRGMIIDESALLNALRSGQLAGAALDVLTGEESFRLGEKDWPLCDPLVKYAKNNDNLILVPHIGGMTIDSLHATEIFMAKKLNNYILEKY